MRILAAACLRVWTHELRVIAGARFRVVGAVFALITILANPAQSQERTEDVALDSLRRSQRCVDAPSMVQLSTDAARLLDELDACLLVSSAVASLPQILADHISWTEAIQVERITVQLVNSYGMHLTPLDAANPGEHLLAASEWHLRIDLKTPVGSAWVMFDRLSGDVRSEWRGAG